ncbi:aldo/keto reductase [Flavobacterium sp. LBUM151]
MGINKIKLGNQGLVVPNIGLGCMGMTQIAGMDIYGKADEKEAIATIHRSIELGGNFLDTADLYGPLLNERLVAKAIKGNRDNYSIATKFGYEIDDNEQLTWKFNGKKEYVKKAVERSLKNLGTDYIDLYYLHRLDPNTPIEETIQAMSDLVKEGKVGYIGLSEVSSETIRKAHKIHPLTAVQTEYSLFERTAEEAGILDTLAELEIGFVAYSPLGRGFISGDIKSPDDFDDNDFRKAIPRFQGEQFYKNIKKPQDVYWSNPSYVAAGLMLEKATGKSYETLVKELGKSLQIDFDFGQPNLKNENEPWGHDENLKPEAPALNYKLNWLSSAGNINVSLPDYCKFTQMQLQGLLGKSKLLSADDFNKMHYSLPEFSFGWESEINENSKLQYSFHNGSPGTFLTKVYICPAINKAFILFANVQSEEADKGLMLLLEKLQNKYGG